MDKSSRLDIPMAEQVQSWEHWNKTYKRGIGNLSPWNERQLAAFLARLESLKRRDLNILDVGCGTGWVCKSALPFGTVTGTDLFQPDPVPGVTFVVGSLFDVPLEPASFNVVSAFEVLSHVADQRAFFARLASLLKPGGHLFIATQNRPILEKWSQIPGPAPGQIRHWVDHHQLRELMEREFENVQIESVVPVGDEGLLRYINSRKLNRLASLVVGQQRLDRAKERAMLGHTLVAWGARR